MQININFLQIGILIEQDEAFYELPQVTMERLLKLEHIMAMEVKEIESLLS